MSLLPYLLDDTPFFRPSRLLDQRFGTVLDPEDFMQTLAVPRYLSRCPAGYFRNWRPTGQDQDSGSVVTYDKDKFQANLDVQQFKPEEITVKVTGENTITIEANNDKLNKLLNIKGKHEEQADEHGHIYRHFVRRYNLPKNVDMSKVQSKLSSDGVLSITAPRIEQNQIEHKSIPITQTGEPVRVEKKSDKAVEQK